MHGLGGRRTHLLLVSLRDHVARHVADALVDNLGHRAHDALCLRTVEALALETLHEVVCVEVEVVCYGRRVERSGTVGEAAHPRHRR